MMSNWYCFGGTLNFSLIFVEGQNCGLETQNFEDRKCLVGCEVVVELISSRNFNIVADI